MSQSPVRLTIRASESENIQKELRKIFSSQPSDIIQIGQDACTIRVSSTTSKFDVGIHDNGYSYSGSSSFISAKITNSTESDNKLFSVNNGAIAIQSGVFSRRRMRKIVDEVHEHYDKVLPYAYYLPAGRYSLMQSYKTLSAQLIKRASLADHGDSSMLGMSGAVTDFLADLLDISPENGPCSDIAAQLEATTLHGSVEMKHSTIPPEINYHYRGHRIPFHRVSSMVSEIAPLVLYMRHLVEPKSLLIVEEPESHLHPHNQLHLAKCIIDLVRSGVYVLITTHSPYLVEQLGNYLQISGLSDSDRDKLHDDKNRYIKPDELAAYLFEMEKDISNIRKVNTSVEMGIDQNQFVEAF